MAISAISSFFTKRDARKRGRDVLRHANHARLYNEDIANPDDLAALSHSEKELVSAIKQGDIDKISKANDSVLTLTMKIAPRRRFAGLRENLEILVVAIAVAMGIRTYFVQPFKIPTGSMQPSLYGIHGIEMEAPGISDRFPFWVVRWAVTGEKYRDIRVQQGGVLDVREKGSKPGLLECRIGGHHYFVPKNDRVAEMNGLSWPTGTLLWRGRQKAGDHVFVNKVVWNFLKPRRGDVMVFSTDRIPGLPEGTHYIKRMCGLPGESIGIDPPYVTADNQRVLKPYSIARVASGKNGYSGYQLASHPSAILRDSDSRIYLSQHQYLALGDNTGNSLDGRYWGAVPEQNLVGPAFLVYWPYSKERWGFIKGH